MLEFLDPLAIDPFAYDRGVLEQIRHFSLLPNKRIGWNYCMDYSWIAMRCQTIEITPDLHIVDVGCGPGAIHGYIEDKYGIDVVGIDMKRWEEDYVDIKGDFSLERMRNIYGFKPGSVDIIISASAFEHNLPAKHRELVHVCIDSLRPGGHLIATFSVAKETMSTPGQWNLSREDIEDIYGEKFDSFKYEQTWQRWRQHRDIPENYKNRYEKWSKSDPPFLSAGAHIVKFF